jgi:hypothetical protein
MTIIRMTFDAVATGALALALRLSIACHRRAEAALWRRSKLRALDQRRRY